MQTPLKLDLSQIKDPDARYAEVGQARPCTYSFAFVKGGVVFPQHLQVKCRDFLNDTLVWDEEKSTGRIWGYTFAGPYDKENTTLYMESAEFLPQHLPLLNEYEKKLGISLTTAQKCDKGLLIVGDKWWQSTTIHLSWYTQVLRHLTYPKLNALEDKSQESMMTHPAYWGLPFKLKGLKLTIKRNAPSFSSMHDNNGFYTQITRGKLINTTYSRQLEEQKECAVSPVTST
jgi:hypothetical protein